MRRTKSERRLCAVFVSGRVPLAQEEEVALKIGKAFEPYVIKEYIGWTLVLNLKQVPYVGRSYAWWRDNSPGEGERMSPMEIPRAERDELFDTIFPDVVLACGALGYKTQHYGKDFLLNMAYLANEEGHRHHIHWHFIPRSIRPVRVEALLGRTFDDHAWGNNYSTVKQGELDGPDEALIIRDTMALAIGGIPHK